MVYCSSSLLQSIKTQWGVEKYLQAVEAFLVGKFPQTAEGEVEENTDESFVEDAADVDARRMAMKAAEGLLCIEVINAQVHWSSGFHGWHLKRQMRGPNRRQTPYWDLTAGPNLKS